VAAPISASEKTKKLWTEQVEFAQTMLDIYSGEKSRLKIEEKTQKLEQFFAASKTEWSGHLKKTLVTLNGLMVGPLSLGDQLSVTDLHLAPWLANIAIMSGASLSSDGDTVISKLQARIGEDFVLPKDFQTPANADPKADPASQVTPGSKRTKLAAFWDEMKARPSWNKLEGLELLYHGSHHLV